MCPWIGLGAKKTRRAASSEHERPSDAHHQIALQPLKMLFPIVLSVFLVCLQETLSQRNPQIEGRYLRPVSQNRPCSSNIRCPETSRDDKYPDETDRDKVRPPTRKEDWLSSDDSGYKPKLETGLGHYDEEGYKSKPPVSDSNDKPRDVFRPKPKDDYETKPIDSDIAKPGNYETQPIIREEYIPKPGSHDNKPEIREEYIPKPGSYETKPIIREEYIPKPGSHDNKPVIREEYIPKPGSHETKPVIREEYIPKPVLRDEYEPKYVPRDEYEPKPPQRDVYEPKPPPRDVYEPKPSPPRGGYNQKPPTRDEYQTKPILRDEYNHKTDRDDYIPRPVDKDEYNPRPVDRGDYGNKPVGASGGYAYPKPAVSGNKDDGYSPYNPSYEDKPKPGYDTKPDDFNDDKPKPLTVVEGDNCICVPYYQCKAGHIVTDGDGIIDARMRPQPDIDLPLDGKFKPPACGPFHVCCNTPESSTVKPYEHRCGVRNPSGINSRILSPSNKGEADFGEWPWQAAVLKSEGTVNIFQCGGVLIDKHHVLTVAHCVFDLYKYNDYPLKIRLGEWDTQTTSEFLAHEDYKVSKITIHPEYRNSSLWNDIAILRLQDPVLFAPHIDTICLPKYDEIFSGQNCVVTGWGKDSYKGGSFSNVMKEVALQVIDNYNCEEMLRKTRLGRFFQLHEGFVCAGGEHGLDSCKGDGGGPLVCYRKDRSYALAGLVSWGIDCGQPGVPGVYVKVQKYLDWISKNTGVNLQDYWPK